MLNLNNLYFYSLFQENYLHSTYEYLGLSESLEDDSIEDQEIPENSIRNFRPPHLEFRIGNVILMHTMIPGIVVGWNIDITVSLIYFIYLFLLIQQNCLFQYINNIK